MGTDKSDLPPVTRATVAERDRLIARHVEALLGPNELKVVAAPDDHRGRVDHPGDIRRLQLMVRFAEDNLDYYRAGDWSNLREDLAGFVSASDSVGPLLTGASPKPTVQELQDLQAEVGLLLRSVATRRVAMTPEGRGVVVRSNRDIPMEARWSLRDGRMIATPATLRDGVLIRLMSLLDSYGHAKIRPCPECGRLFWRVRRQLYCSRTCVNRVNMRNWTKAQKHAAKKKSAQRSARKRGGRK